MCSTRAVCENVNGALLTLTVQKASPDTARRQRRFTISFGRYRQPKDAHRAGAMYLLLIIAPAVAFNVLAMMYAQLGLSTVLVTTTVLAVLTVMWVTHSVQYESILVVPSVGIESSVKYVLGLEEHFMPWSSIEDVIINEVIHLNRVLYYLTVLVQDSGETKLIPLFKYTKPRLTMIENIYSEIQALLNREKDENKNE